MNEIDLKQLWQTAHQKLDDNLALNRQNAIRLTHLQVGNLLSTMQPTKRTTLLIGLVWVILVDSLLLMVWQKASIFFIGSAILQVLISKISMGIYIYQMTLISQIDLASPVLESQSKLIKLQISTLWTTRIAFLQLPLWTTFYLSSTMLANGNLTLWVFQITITCFFTGLALWLFVNINYENRHKKWFLWLFGSNEWLPLLKAMEFLDEMKGYEQE